jgi:hypothetical protein
MRGVRMKIVERRNNIDSVLSSNGALSAIIPREFLFTCRKAGRLGENGTIHILI